MLTAFITGVSSGIGYALAKSLLEKNYCVYGISRRTPRGLLKHENFHYRSIDVTSYSHFTDEVIQLIKETEMVKINYLFLNVGEFNKRIAPIIDTPIGEYEHLMRLNVWSCKIILDLLLRSDISIETVIFSSSIAGSRARKGMGPYAISKAALNMMAKLYALEHPDIFFSVLGLCNVSTFLAENVMNLPLLGEFNELEALRNRVLSEKDYLVSPEKRAQQIIKLLETDLKSISQSGEFVEIRELLKKSGDKS